ncbi:hypothetical protein BSL78_02203 [Apostichopus japonicus]|uniref:Uncharacterized protein n=1 Tax=Stichopus japonicus TaxID=307972 RepID=A0A2G8LKU8_STIJA|nr:hypothetical protein BSL78_02203 [Apostichopus japonicus]
MTSRHIKVLDENAQFCEKFGLKIAKDKNGCFLQHTNNKQADLQQLKATIRNHVKNDWEIFAIEILEIPKYLVAGCGYKLRPLQRSKMEESSERRICLESEFQYRNHRFFSVKSSILSGNNKCSLRLFVDQIEIVIREITAEHIGMMDGIKTHNNLEKKNILSEFNLQSVEKDGRYYFRNLDSTQSEKSSNDETICQQDPPTIESRVDMLKLQRNWESWDPQTFGSIEGILKLKMKPTSWRSWIKME